MKYSDKEVWDNLQTLGKDRFLFLNMFTAFLIVLIIYFILKLFLGISSFTFSIWFDLLALITIVPFTAYTFSKKYWDKNEQKYSN